MFLKLSPPSRLFKITPSPTATRVFLSMAVMELREDEVGELIFLKLSPLSVLFKITPPYPTATRVLLSMAVME